MNKTGIYKITAPDGAFYIGSATKNFDRVWVAKRSELNSYIASDTELQESWVQHGEDSMRFAVMLFCSDEYCAMHEKSLIKRYKPSLNNVPIEPTEESKTVFRIKERKKSVLSKAVICVENNISFDSIRSVIEWLQSQGHANSSASSTNISGACKGKRSISYGFHWRYANDS